MITTDVNQYWLISVFIGLMKRKAAHKRLYGDISVTNFRLIVVSVWSRGQVHQKHTHTHTEAAKRLTGDFPTFHWLKVHPKDPSYHIISLYIDYVYWLEPNPTGGRADVNCCSDGEGRRWNDCPENVNADKWDIKSNRCDKCYGYAHFNDLFCSQVSLF